MSEPSNETVLKPRKLWNLLFGMYLLSLGLILVLMQYLAGETLTVQPPRWLFSIGLAVTLLAGYLVMRHYTRPAAGEQAEPQKALTRLAGLCSIAELPGILGVIMISIASSPVEGGLLLAASFAMMLVLRPKMA